MKALTAHWSANLRFTNIGDYLTLPLLREILGEEPDQQPELQRGIVEGHQFLVLGVGSVLNSGFSARYPVPTKFWGSGVGMRSPSVPLRANQEILAARGPITKELMGVPNVPTGDPAFLFPAVFPDFASGACNGVSAYIPHLRSITNNELGRKDMLNMVGAEKYLTTLFYEDDAWDDLLNEILEPEFVGTGSLHAFILRKAYGLGAALVLPPGVAISCEVKWADTFAWLGIPGTVEDNTCPTLEEGRTWWEETGEPAVIPDLQPLLDALPYAHSFTLS